MKLHNTLSRTKEDFQQLKAGHVSLYTCGPTVYDNLHIGNWRNQVFNDTLRRTLLLNQFKVHQVMNITDVGHLVSDADEGEDKLEKGAKREGKTVREVAQFYIDAFKTGSRTLTILPPTQLIRATDTIAAQINLVQRLFETDFVYQTKTAIYFDVTKLDDYGKLSGQKLADKEVGARDEVVTDPNKRHPYDFAVWFFTVGHFQDHEMRWPSPWGEGFPGWHLECSAIIHESLGEPIDIHTGGVDHIGTHHTNEIAQSEAAFGVPLAHYWVHNEFLLVNGQKMSKSLGNVYTLKDVTAKGYDPMALRLLYLQAHYRTQQNFTWEALDAATTFLARLQAWADGQFQEGASTLADDVFAGYQQRITAAVSDDLGTPQALAIISEVLDEYEGNFITPTPEQVRWVDQILGLQLDQRYDITPEQKAILAERESARVERDFATADHARSALEGQDIKIEDTAGGPRWSRV